MAAFPRQEYLGRIDNVKARMAAAGVDVLLCADPANMNYLTGYDGWSFYVPQYVAVPADADEPIWIGRAMDAAGARLTTFVSEENIRPYPETHVDSAELHPMAHVADLLEQMGCAGARIGVETDCWYYTARAHETLKGRLPQARIVDAFGLVNRVRLIKSAAEIAYMRIAAKIVGAAMREGIDAIAPGVRECDVAGRIAAVQFSGTETHAGDYPAALASIPSGAKTAAPHLTWSGDRYQRDTIAYLELGGCHRRYHAALARTVCLGRPPAAVVSLAGTVAEGMEAALDRARAGERCCDVEAAWRAVIAGAGYEKESRIGYSIGLGYPPDWGERTVSLISSDRTELAPNMCFHVILGMWQGDWGYELSETIRITEAGPPDVLTDFPRTLVVKES